VKRDEERIGASTIDAPIHLPSNTFMPLLLAIALTTAAYGIVYLSDPNLRFVLSIPLIAVGVVLTFIAIFRWIQVSRIDSPHVAH